MRTIAVIAVTVAALSGPVVAQDTKPVPKDSVRVTVSGCTKGYVFTAGPSTPDLPGSLLHPRGHMHLRMNRPKKMIAAIDAYKEFDDRDYRPHEEEPKTGRMVSASAVARG